MSRCKQCCKNAVNAWRLDNVAHLQQYQSKYDKEHPQNNERHKLYRYKLSPEAYEQLLLSQNNKCGLCGINLSLVSRPGIDHDYETNLIRAILCVKCNTGLGMFDDNPQKLRDAADYIERHKLRSVI